MSIVGIAAIGAVGILAAISGITGTTGTISKIAESQPIVSAPDYSKARSLFQFDGIRLIGAFWHFGGGFSVKLSGTKNPGTDRYPLVSLQSGSFEADIANYPSGAFFSKGGQLIMLLLFAFSASISIHPICKVLGSKTEIKESISFFVSALSLYLAVSYCVALIFFNVIFRLLEISIVSGILIYSIIFVFPLILAVVRSLIVGLSELYCIKKRKIALALIGSVFVSALTTPFILVPGAYIVGIFYELFDSLL